MARGFDVGEDFLNFALLVNKESRAGDPHYPLAIHILLLHDAVGFADFLVRVSQQDKRQIEFGLEFGLGL